MEFTKQELLVIFLMAKGCKGPDIAAQLHISPNTVKAHKHSIAMKLKGTGIKPEQLSKLSLELLQELLAKKDRESKQ